MGTFFHLCSFYVGQLRQFIADGAARSFVEAGHSLKYERTLRDYRHVTTFVAFAIAIYGDQSFNMLQLDDERFTQEKRLRSARLALAFHDIHWSIYNFNTPAASHSFTFASAQLVSIVWTTI